MDYADKIADQIYGPRGSFDCHADISEWSIHNLIAAGAREGYKLGLGVAQSV